MGSLSGPPLISVCLPVHGRTNDLRETLPGLARAAEAAPPVEIVVVDYASPDDLGDYLASVQPPPGVRLTTVCYRGRTYYHMAHARNLSVRGASGEWVLLWSADLGFKPQTVTIMRAAIRDLGTNATWMSAFAWRETLLMKRDTFIAAGGYDERFEFYGPEGKDLVARLRRRGEPYAQMAAAFYALPDQFNKKTCHHYRLPLTKGEMSRRGKSIWHENEARGVLVANAGRDWGSLHDTDA